MKGQSKNVIKDEVINIPQQLSIPLSKVKVPYLLLDSGRAVKVEGPLFDAISADSSLKKAPVIYQSHFQDCPKANNF